MNNFTKMFGSTKNTILISTVVTTLATAIGFYLSQSKHQKLVKDITKWAQEHRIKLVNTTAPQSFKVAFDQQEWDSLVSKIDTTRHFTSLDDKYALRNDYGPDPDFISDLLGYWKTKFDWKKSVNQHVNKYAQFTVNINDSTVHFVRHTIGNEATAVPLLLLDGWPGAFFSFYEALDYLESVAQAQGLSFDVIIPTIPGFGYSNPQERAHDPYDVAQIFDALMRMHHGDQCRYFVHGEDWGSVIATILAQLYPTSVRGIHITMPTVLKSYDPMFSVYFITAHFAPSLILTQQEMAHERNKLMYDIPQIAYHLLRFSGYFHMQATKPDALGYGLTDSPIGLMSYLMTMYSLGTLGPDAIGMKLNESTLLKKLNRDTLLRIVTYYWMSNSITSSMRIYKATVDSYGAEWPKNEMMYCSVPSEVPVGVQVYRNEVMLTPKKMFQIKYPNVKQYTLHDVGGHFASLENPKMTMDDLLKFIKSCQ